MDIRNESDIRLFHLIRMGHPDEKGEPYKRFEVIEEIEKRGYAILSSLEWPSHEDAIYKNLYTGSETTLKELMDNEHGIALRDESPMHNLFSVLEHWSPKEKWDNTHLNNQEKSKLTAFL